MDEDNDYKPHVLPWRRRRTTGLPARKGGGPHRHEGAGEGGEGGGVGEAEPVGRGPTGGIGE